MAFQLTQEEGEFLVRLARKTVEGYLKNDELAKVPKNLPPKLMQRCGVFVTINRLKNDRKELRGCIGYPYPTAGLAQAVVECAISSATRDPRFHPLSPKELDEVIFEVSVLTPPEPVEVENPKHLPSNIKVGTDGLIVERGIYKGLLLPQVPVECSWDEEEFLCQCCLKAGLPPDNWLIKNTKIHKFQAVIFGEERPKGEIRRKELGGK